jgi:ABC-2 type transport system permease protein
VVFLLVAVAALASARWLMDIPVESPVAVLLWMTLSGPVLLLLLTSLQLCAASQQTAHIVAFLVVFPLGMLGGGFFPFEFMPEWMARIGRLTPNGYALVQLKALMEGPVAPARLAAGFAALAAAGAVLFPLALWRLRRISAT